MYHLQFGAPFISNAHKLHLEIITTYLNTAACFIFFF